MTDAEIITALRAHYTELDFLNEVEFLIKTETRLLALAKCDDLTPAEKSRVAMLPRIQAMLT